MSDARYAACEFFAITFRGKRTGHVLLVCRGIVNGTCCAGIATPRGANVPVDALPTQTWVSPVMLAKYHRISEAQARILDPMFFRAVDGYENDPSFRKTHDKIRFRSVLQPIVSSYSVSATSPV